MLPTHDTLVFERFFDAVGGMQLLIHSPHGSRLNRAWGVALRKRFCTKINFELQAAATEDNIVLSLTTAHSFDLADVPNYLHPATVRELLVQAVPIPTRWDDGVYAAHVVAAAGTAALAGSADVGTIFQRMLAALKSMHDANPSAGPLFVAHPGNMKRHHAYVAA